MNLVGRTIGNYQVRAEIGRGGMGVVYRAYQPSLNRYVAIKVLPPQFTFDSQFVERFQREARAAAGLRHPNIVVIHDVGQENDTYYIVMEFLEGRTLRELIQQEGPLPPRRVTHILEQVAAALDYAHQRGFVHRDIKPANIFVGEGDRVTLTDFGIAKAASETQQLTRTGTLMGTPEYMSPEQAEGGTVDHRTDLYALGVVLYQMLVGRVPFRGTTPHAVLHDVIYEPPPSPRQINPNLSPALEAVILKSINKQPGRRFQRGAEMIKALRQAMAGVAPADAGPPPEEWRSPTPRRGTPPAASRAAASRAPAAGRRTSPVVWILAGIAAVLVLIIGALLLIVLSNGGGNGTPLPTTTAIAAVDTATMAPTSTTESAASEEPAATTAAPPPTATSGEVAPTATTIPTNSPVPPTNTPVPPTHTPVPPTHTPVPPTHTPTSPPPPPTCAIQAQGIFGGLWQTYKNQLGCPAYAEAKIIQDAEQPFQTGHMFWREDNDQVYVVFEGGSQSGGWRLFGDVWSEGDPHYSCTAPPPPAGTLQPYRGFGAAWCLLGAENSPTGWATADEVGFWGGNGDPLVQEFERGVIFRDSDGKTKGLAYVLFSDSKTFVRVPY